MLVFRGVQRLPNLLPIIFNQIRQFNSVVFLNHPVYVVTFRTVVAFFVFFGLTGDHSRTRCFCASFDNFKYSTSVIQSCQVHFLEENLLATVYSSKKTQHRFMNPRNSPTGPAVHGTPNKT